MPEIKIPWYGYKISQGFETKAELTDFPIQDKSKVKADTVIMYLRHDFPYRAESFNHGYPKLRKIGEMEIWNQQEYAELSTILISLGFEVGIGRDGDILNWSRSK